MAIPTQRAGPSGPSKEVGRTPEERRGYTTPAMPPPEQVRRHNRIAEQPMGDRYVPDKVRK